MIHDPRKGFSSKFLSKIAQKSRYHKLNLDNPLLRGALVVLSFTFLLLLLTPFQINPPEELTNDDIGAIASKRIKANKKFTYSRVDEQTTASVRKEQIRKVPLIYKWDVSRSRRSKERIQSAFREMRMQLSAVEQTFELQYRSDDSLQALPPTSPQQTNPADDASMTPADAALGLVQSIVAGSGERASELSQSLGVRREALRLAQAMRRANIIGVSGGFSIREDTLVPRKTRELERLQAEQARREALTKALENQLYKYATDHRRAFEQQLGRPIQDEIYRMLIDQRFNEALESDITDLLGVVFDHPIAESKLDRGLVPEGIIQIEKYNNDAPLGGEPWVHQDPSAIPDLELATLKDLPAQASARLQGRSGLQLLQVQGFARSFLRANLTFDEASTLAKQREISRQVEDRLVQQVFQRGETIVDEGRPITAEHLAIYRSMKGDAPRSNKSVLRTLGQALFILLALGLVYVLMRRDLLKKDLNRRDLIFIGSMLLVMTLLVRISPPILQAWGEAWEVHAPGLMLLMIPFAMGSMLLGLVLNGAVAAAFAIVFALLISPLLEVPQLLVPFVLVSGVCGAIVLRQAKTRMSVLQAGAKLGLVNATCAVALLLILKPEGVVSGWGSYALASVFAFASGIASAFLVTTILPIVEHLFGYTTAIKLLELANLEHPLLKQLLLRSPGSYHHSMMVGSLNEAAAEAIGANSLLTRVGAYYHDIGKMKNPQYFAENQQGDNPHDRLKPHLSALILKSHVKDGIEMARQHKLPQDIIDFIATHHGTSRIEYFYRRAKDLESPDIPEVREENYRYPGPRPQSRETGICMISDSVEAAVRSLPEKTPDRIKGMVQKLINQKFTDGQFSECNLTLADLNAIAEALLRILSGIYHKRPEYPDSKRKASRRSISRPSTKPDVMAESSEEDKAAVEQASVIDALVAEVPAVEELVVDASVEEAPAVEEPVVETSAEEAPIKGRKKKPKGRQAQRSPRRRASQKPSAPKEPQAAASPRTLDEHVADATLPILSTDPH